MQMIPLIKRPYFLVISLWLTSWCIGVAQTYIPGDVYFDTTGYVAYRAGNLPIILSAPHGGSLEPSVIPDRTCDNCVTVKDAWTQPIAEGMYEAIVEQTGCYPHLIVNLLHRKKFDANRDIGDAANGDPTVELAWESYHNFIDSAKTQVGQSYDRGLFLDIHGHAHTIQRIELGYLLSGLELQLSDAMLNTMALVEESSVRTLASDNRTGHTHAALIRGADSFGTLIDEEGFPAVPSVVDPFPMDGEPYFEGGYNTRRHGSRDNAGHIDAIQIELNQDIRFVDSTRLLLIEALAATVLDYYGLHYNKAFSESYCNLVSHVSQVSIYAAIKLYPNPADDYLIVESELSQLDLRIYNAIGQEVIDKAIGTAGKIDLTRLEAGLYVVQIFEGNNFVASRLLSIN